MNLVAEIENEFDVILNMEVVEHVSNVNLFMQNCSKLIKKMESCGITVAKSPSEIGKTLLDKLTN